jgi:hypothetical protein
MSKKRIGRPAGSMLKGRSGDTMAGCSQRSRSAFNGREHGRKMSGR